MDSNRFDALAKGLAKNAPRRSILKGLGATALGATLGLSGRRADAKGVKVSICHVTESGSYNYISVSENAVPAHLAHGDVVTDLTDVGNCGACGNACSAPENAAASCSSGSCSFTCADGYELNEAGDACVATSLCPPGYDPVNGACFEIADGLNEASCTNQCNVFGSVDGSFQYICALPVYNESCSSTADCPAGLACFSNAFCIQSC